jgi:hypothetical protein
MSKSASYREMSEDQPAGRFPELERRSPAVAEQERLPERRKWLKADLKQN